MYLSSALSVWTGNTSTGKGFGLKLAYLNANNTVDHLQAAFPHEVWGVKYTLVGTFQKCTVIKLQQTSSFDSEKNRATYADACAAVMAI